MKRELKFCLNLVILQFQFSSDVVGTQAQEFDDENEATMKRCFSVDSSAEHEHELQRHFSFTQHKIQCFRRSTSFAIDDRFKK